MRYQIYTSMWGTTRLRHVLFYERDGTVFRFQSKRISYVQLPVTRLEDVTEEMIRLGGETTATPILEASEDTEPLDLLRGFEAAHAGEELAAEELTE